MAPALPALTDGHVRRRSVAPPVAHTPGADNVHRAVIAYHLCDGPAATDLAKLCQPVTLSD